MFATWKIRTDYANAVDIFDKVSPWFKESGARMTNVTHNIGGDDNTFTMVAGFESYEAFGKNDDAWASSPEWWQKMQPNFVNNQLVEAVYLTELIGNIKGAVTEITELDVFYPAEGYHQNYFNDNSNQPYCRMVILPKIQQYFRD